MSKPEPEYWAVTVKVNYSAQTYWDAEVRRLPDPTNSAPLRGPYVQVEAFDEIGAFNEAQKVLRRMGFRLA